MARTSPCQGEGRRFESGLPLRIGIKIVIQFQREVKPSSVKIKMPNREVAGSPACRQAGIRSAALIKAGCIKTNFCIIRVYPAQSRRGGTETGSATQNKLVKETVRIVQFFV